MARQAALGALGAGAGARWGRGAAPCACAVRRSGLVRTECLRAAVAWRPLPPTTVVTVGHFGPDGRPGSLQSDRAGGPQSRWVTLRPARRGAACGRRPLPRSRRPAWGSGRAAVTHSQWPEGGWAPWSPSVPVGGQRAAVTLGHPLSPRLA